MSAVLTPSLQQVIVHATGRAVLHRNKDVTLDHLFRAVLDEPEGAALIAALGADVSDMTRELDEFLELIETEPARGYRPPTPDFIARRTFERAFLHAASARLPEVGIGDLLVALVREPDAYPALLLHAAGIDPVDVKRLVTHGTRDFSLPPAGARRMAVWLHNDHYTTMEFVVAVLQKHFRIAFDQAARFMMIVHREGKAAVGDWPAPVALRMAEAAMRSAARNDFPLRVTVEEL